MEERAQLTTTEEEGLSQPRGAVRAAPAVDIYESKDELLVVADLPGVPPGALKVHLDPPHLYFEGLQQALNEDTPPVQFIRAFRVPSGVDQAGVSAELKQGVLTIRLRKAESAKPREIPVQAA